MALCAIVFDFDGVIANSEPLHFRAYHDVLGTARVNLSERDYYERYLGYDDIGTFRAIAADRGLVWGMDRIEELVAIKAQRMEVLEGDMSILFPGAAAAVRRASASVPLAIASGALGHEIRRVLDRERLTECFVAVVAAEDTPASKPAPDPYLRALTLLSTAAGSPLPAARCVAIEDSPWGLQSARSAGLRTVAVAHTYDKSALDADAVIPSLAELDMRALERLCSD